MPLLIVAFLAWVGTAAAQPVTVFTAPTNSPYLATEGLVDLVWEAEPVDDSIQFQLQQSSDSEFSEVKTRYEGLDRGTYVSGLLEGDYYFRVRTLAVEGEPGPWSDPMHVQVRYVSHTLVFWLMSIGSIVFIATVLTVIKGHLRSRKPVN